MTSVNKGVRIGAAAFALGLSLAGPQAVGVAFADRGDSSSAASPGPTAADAASPSASPAPASRRGAAQSRATATPRAVSAVAAGRDAPGSSRRNSAPAAAQRPTGLTRAGALPSSASVQPTPEPRVAVSAPVAASPAPAAAVAPPFGSVAAPAIAAKPQRPRINQAVGSMTIAAAGAIDELGKRLSSFPANPISEVLTGGLWLMRRALVPVGADVGLWGSAACVATKNCEDKDLTGVDLRGADLSGVSLTNATMARANLSRANLTSVLAGRADLTGARMVGVTATDTDFAQSILSGAVLTRAKLTLTDMELSLLGGAQLRAAQLDRVNLLGVDLAGVGLSGVRWTDVTCPSGSKSDGGCTSTPPGGPDVLGQFMIPVWNKTYFTIDAAPIGICFGGGSNVASNTAAGCQPPADPSGAGTLYQSTLQHLTAGGDAYYDFGGGNQVATQQWNVAAINELNNYMPVLKSGYQGIFYDIEAFDPLSFDVDTMYAAFAQSFAQAKNLGFKVMASTSYTAPYYENTNIPPISQTDELWEKILADPNVDFFAPQFYNLEGYTALIVTTTKSSVGFSTWTDTIAGGGVGKIIPILKAWAPEYLANQVNQMNAACSATGQAFCSTGYILWPSS